MIDSGRRLSHDFRNVTQFHSVIELERIAPAVEVHISDVDSREDFRQISYAGMACEKRIVGQGIDGYRQAIEYLMNKFAARP